MDTQMTHTASPVIFGILNITEDSFSDGGKYLNKESALVKVSELIQEGAHVIDVGPASSNPASAPVPPDIQIARAAGIVSYLKHSNIPVSLDVCEPQVQSWAIDQNADYINDIEGFKNPEILEKLQGKKTKLIVMHSVQQSSRADKRHVDAQQILELTKSFFYSRLETLHKYNIGPERIILDPGMGFFLGSNALNSVNIIKNIKNLKEEFPFAFLISVSRKSFLGEITGRAVNRRDLATLAAEIFCVFEQNADMIRTHNPGALKDGILIWNSFLSGK